MDLDSTSDSIVVYQCPPHDQIRLLLIEDDKLVVAHNERIELIDLGNKHFKIISSIMIHELDKGCDMVDELISLLPLKSGKQFLAHCKQSVLKFSLENDFQIELQSKYVPNEERDFRITHIQPLEDKDTLLVCQTNDADTYIYELNL